MIRIEHKNLVNKFCQIDRDTTTGKILEELAVIRRRRGNYRGIFAETKSR